MDAGEPVEDSNDLVGKTVQKAARVCAEAQSGQILVSEDLYAIVEDQFPAELALEKKLKGFSEPVKMYSVSPD